MMIEDNRDDAGLEEPEEKKEEATPKWYVAHTFSGYENKVKTDLEKTIKNRNLQNQIFRVEIPVQEVVESKDSKKESEDEDYGLGWDAFYGGRQADDKKPAKKKQRKSSVKKIFPAYVLVNMILNDDTWYVVRNTRGVTGFVGPGSEPVALTDDEIKELEIFMSTPQDKIKFKEGDLVRVTSEIWLNTEAVIRSINSQKHTATIYVNVLGRETQLELSFSELERVE